MLQMTPATQPIQALLHRVAHGLRWEEILFAGTGTIGEHARQNSGIVLRKRSPAPLMPQVYFVQVSPIHLGLGLSAIWDSHFFIILRLDFLHNI